MMHIDLRLASQESQEAGREQKYTWHIGEKLPFSPKDVKSVIEIQADGDELNAIVDQGLFDIYGIEKQVLRFFGDQARFIIGNLDTTYNKRKFVA
jgi:hypothetical protein